MINNISKKRELNLHILNFFLPLSFSFDSKASNFLSCSTALLLSFRNTVSFILSSNPTIINPSPAFKFRQHPIFFLCCQANTILFFFGQYSVYNYKNSISSKKLSNVVLSCLVNYDWLLSTFRSTLIILHLMVERGASPQLPILLMLILKPIVLFLISSNKRENSLQNRIV